MKKVFVRAFVALFFSLNCFAVDLTFKLTPALFMPQDSDNFSNGFGGFLSCDVDLLGFASIGGEVGYNSIPFNAVDGDVSCLSGGGHLNFYYSPFSRIFVSVGGGGGVYQVTWTDSSNKSLDASDYYYRGYGELGFRATPEFTICAMGGYVNYLASGDAFFNKGVITCGIGFRYAFSTSGNSSSSFSVDFEQDGEVFPVFMNAYKNCPLGTLTLTNNEPSEIKNVHVSFRAGKYTSETYESAFISRINRHSKEEIPLYASFSPEILKYVETGKILGEVVVEYELLGKKRQSVQNITLDVFNRNAFVWSDPSALSAFISGETPEVQQIAKSLAGVERNFLIPAMNQNLQFAAGIFEGLRLAGIKYSSDKITPYASTHLSDDVDMIQYPLQTLEYGSGDFDDLGILYASCLESIGVPTGYMIFDDDFVVLVGMNIRSNTAINHFALSDGLIIDDNNVYFGVSMANFEKGFAAARKAAFKKIAAAKKDDSKSYDYADTYASWQVYAPAIFSGNGISMNLPSNTALEKAFKNAINDYINSELANVIARAQKSGDLNKLGVAYLRSGKISEAKAEFAKLNTVSAMNNLANCYVIEKNYSSAKSLYKKVLAKDPQNKVALAGLADVNERLGVKD